MQEIHSKTEETKISKIKSKQHLMDLNETFNFTSENFDEFDRGLRKKNY